MRRHVGISRELPRPVIVSGRAVPGYDQRRFLAVVAVAGVGLGMTAPLTVLFASGFGVSDLFAGLAVSSVAVSLLAVDVFGTKFVPRVDGRTMVWVSMTVFGAGSFASALAPSIELMIAARMLQGAGAALFMGGALQVVVRFAPPGRAGRAVGTFNAAWFSGIAVGPFVGGSLAAALDGQAGFRLAFVVCGTVCLVVAMAARLLLPSIPGAAPPRISLPHLARARPGWTLWRPLTLAAFGQAVRGGLVFTVIPLFGERELGLSTSTVGLALSALAAFDILAMRVGGEWADRLGRRPILVGALLVGTASGVLAPLVEGPLAFAVWCAVVALTVGVTWVVPIAVVIDVVEEPEAGLATYRIGADVGQLGGSAGAGALVGSLGGEGTLVAIGLAFAVVAGWVARVPETGRAARQPEPSTAIVSAPAGVAPG